MPGNRKAATDFIVKYIEKLLPGSQNTPYYQDFLGKMSDKEFEDFMTKIDEGKIILPIISENLGKVKLEVERNFKIADELGLKLFQRIWIQPENGGPRYLTPEEYLVVLLPVRRQAQILTKKISIPEDNNSIDDLTGQPTGKSKGSKISSPELQIMAADGALDNCIVELIKYRGGDAKGFNIMNNSIAKTGGVSLKAIEPYAGKVKSTETLRVLLTSMHLGNTL